MAAGFLSATFSTEYPDSRWKIPVISAGYALALNVAVNRVLSGNHFISDVLAGAAIGSLYGYLVPWIHLQNKKNASVTFTPVLNGFVIAHRF
jgi:undecaprenyl-diphosphatase